MHVIIVGAGPSGLTLALILAKASIKTTLLEAAPTLDDRPRAAHYAPSAIRVLRAAGVLDDVRCKGLIPKNMTWRKIDGSIITSIPNVAQHPYNPDALTVLPLDQLGRVLLDHCEKNPNCKVVWNSNVVSVGSDESRGWAIVKDGDGDERTWEADYVIGCDGASSQVRRTLFGSSFPGKTWNAQIIATNVYYPLDKFGFDDVNFIIHNEDYYMAAKITNDGLWRVSYGEDTRLTIEECKANQPIKYERMLPGNPKPGDYKLLNVGPYRIHQRCAEKFRIGKILLAADAAHVCNPFGGMGLTGGLVDVGGLAECLIGILNGLADDDILDKYDRVRRDIYKTVIDPVSSDNFLRVSATDPNKALTEDQFLMFVEKAKTDTQARIELDQAPYSICHDFTKYYNKK